MKIEVKTKKMNIQDIKEGMYVRSFDIDKAEQRYNEVLATHLPIIEKDRQMEIVFEDGGSIVTSVDHPMCYKINGKWDYKKSGKTEVGDIAYTLDNKEVKVKEVVFGRDLDDVIANEQFYDITVNKDNNFFSGSTEENLYCVHNSSTSYYPFWHLEVDSLIVLKNNKGTEDNRVRTMDYGIQLNKLFYKRVQQGKDITLFSPHEVPDLYEAFAGDSDEFEKLYKKYEKQEGLTTKKVSAMDLFKSICMERFETGRIYIMNMDHCNTHSPFIDKIFQSNLCVEIALPTTPIEHIDEGENDAGEIALCLLGGINMGKTSLKELPNICDLIVRALDYVIDYQDYPVKAAEKMKKRRSIGVGLTNMAYFLAKNKVSYEDKEALPLVDEYVEAYQYSLLKASVGLAKEFGKCEYFDRTKFSQGILPIDTYNKNVDKVCNRKLTCDWEELRDEIKVYGIRNSTLSAVMPAESSAVVSNATNGIEPPRALVSHKKSKKGVLTQVVPDIDKLANHYTTAFEMKSNKGYIELAAVIQKYVDQAISVNNYYDPSKYEGGNQPISEIMEDVFYHYSLGGKTMYYANTADGKSDDNLLDENIKVEEESDNGCAGGACTL